MSDKARAKDVNQGTGGLGWSERGAPQVTYPPPAAITPSSSQGGTQSGSGTGNTSNQAPTDKK